MILNIYHRKLYQDIRQHINLYLILQTYCLDKFLHKLTLYYLCMNFKDIQLSMMYLDYKNTILLMNL